MANIDDQLALPVLSGTGGTLTLAQRLVAHEWAIAAIFNWHNLIFLVFIIAIFFVGKMLYTLPFMIDKFRLDFKRIGLLDEQLTKSDNKAIAISFVGFMAGVGFMLRGSFSKVTADLGLTVVYALMWTALGFVFLIIAQILNDKIILKRFFNQKGILGGNIAVGLLEAGSYIATGLIQGAALEGITSSILDNFLTTLLWFVLGQTLLILFTFVYKVLTRYDDVAEIAKGNPAAGLGFGMTVVALGILLANPVSKSDSLLAFFLAFILGTIVLVILRYLGDLLIIPGRSIDREIAEDQNWGAALIEGSLAVGTALLITSFLKRVVLCGADAPSAV